MKNNEFEYENNNIIINAQEYFYFFWNSSQ